MANTTPGSILNNRFLIIQKLGQGNFGYTFHGFDLDLKRNVVFKILKTHEDPKSEELLRNEEAILSQISNRYIVKSLGYFSAEGANSACLICFEYSDSVNLYSHIDVLYEQDHSAEYQLLCLVTYLAQSAEGVGAMHAVGLIHRDVKPQNIIVDNENHARIIDFGIATFQGSPEASDFSGTMAFLAPEILNTNASPMSDIYSLGITMFNVLANTYPLLNLPISLKYYLEEYYDNIPKDILKKLDEIFLKATMIKPQDRYANGIEMAAELWNVASLIRPLAFNISTKDKVTPIYGGTLSSIKEVVDKFNSLILNSETLRRPYYRLDGLLIEPEKRYSVSNRTPAFLFDYNGIQYQINSDSLRKAMYRLVDNSERLQKFSNDYDRLLIPVVTKDGTRALRLASSPPNSEGLIPAEGFYCYACEDMQKKNFLG